MAFTATTATTATILPIMTTILPIMTTMVLLHPAHLLDLQATATIQVVVFTMAQNHTMDLQEARHMETIAMVIIMALVSMPTALVALLVALTAGPKTCHRHMSMQPEAPLAITMASNMALHQKGLDIDVVAMAMDLAMDLECTMAVLLLVGLNCMNSAHQVIINLMVRFMDIMGLVEAIMGR